MKNKLVIILLTLSTVMALIGLYTASFSALSPFRPVTIATTPWEPFVGPNLKSNGPVGNLVSETIYRMGYKPEFSYSSWDLCLDKTEKQFVLGTFPGIKSVEREERFVFSDPIMKTDYVLFFNKKILPKLAGDKDPEGFRNIIKQEKYKFGKVKGYEEWKELKEFLNDYFTSPNDTVRLYNTVNEAFQALADNEVQFLIEGKISGLLAVKEPSLAADKSLFGFIDTGENDFFSAKVDWHLLLKKKPSSGEFLTKFNKTMAEVKKKSSYLYEMEQIEKNSNSVDFEKVVLKPIGVAKFANVYLNPEGGESIAVPNGTKAVVLEWPQQFTGFQQIQPTLSNCRIKLLNGPMTGRVFWVNSQSISLIN